MHKCPGMHLALHEMSVIINLFLQQYDLELVTPDPQPTKEMRASRPTLCWVRYRRRGAAARQALLESGRDRLRASLDIGGTADAQGKDEPHGVRCPFIHHSCASKRKFHRTLMIS